jgi:hypothetical protein
MACTRRNVRGRVHAQMSCSVRAGSAAINLPSSGTDRRALCDMRQTVDDLRSRYTSMFQCTFREFSR